ncbi:unnamed protein product [Protopolystoma xenopodis]|uniref:Uncharacterized protein n=1 Tax=Protopolystoma xenopodis TaxID=117903 RepID=A0A3S4ZXA9_9PLAT|nr:unnamed protein product [Protopolystoma xenopodis]
MARSKVAQENYLVFDDAYKWSLQMLTDAIDDTINLNELLTINEEHMLEDVNRCTEAVEVSYYSATTSKRLL